MLIACNSNGSAQETEGRFGGLRLVPSPDELTRLLMQADRVTDSDFNALVRQVTKAIGNRSSGEQHTHRRGFV
jgi:hypothetical protein